MKQTAALSDALAKRILILDGAMGTMLQSFHFTESDFRGTVFADHPCNLTGDNDVLNLTQPGAVLSVHTKYLEAGADIIETNTFNANRFSQAEYGLADKVYELNRAGAAIARSAADSFTELTPGKPRFVAGSIGPSGKTLSMSPSVADPAFRELTFFELADAYHEAAAGLLDGGADILLIETIFDTLNAKAAIYAISKLKEERGGEPIPVMISGTLSDASGRLLAGQNVEAFLISVMHTPDLLSIGFNCALGATEMKPYIAELARKAPCRISAHPNAGLPDELGRYKQTPQEMGAILRSFADEGLLNIAGGCCGTNPDHIRAIAQALEGAAPRPLKTIPPALRLAGLDPLVSNPELPFLNVGERTNVAGSRKFLRLIKEGNMEEALRIARNQVENGATVIDINMDDAMLDAAAELSRFLLRLAGEPDIARVPVMIDSSNFEAIRAGLACAQGKSIVNSISLKEGEEIFLEHAKEARRFGAALLCMAFDEHGQADTLERRVEVCRRMYRLLTEQANIPASDIIFDVNVFAVATGLPEHDSYGKDFIESVRILKNEMPDVHFSGGISNVSFSFRGNEPVRAALHSVFLCHAIRAGLDMGIVNPAQLEQYEELDPVLRAAAEAVILNTSPDAGTKLLEIASGFAGQEKKDASGVPEWRSKSLEERIAYALIHGDDAFLADDMAEALNVYPDPVRIIEGPLMDGMNEVGVRFGAGKMFLPQVVKTARVMKNAVSHLMPAIQSKRSDAARKPVVVLATVKGDVHDIGKNIVGVVLQCNNFEVIDLGVMVPPETIVQTALEKQADIIALSGLITPSLEEMGIVADELEKRKLSIPLMVGGAAASRTHTALKLQPRYPNGIVVYTTDASQCTPAAMLLADPVKRGPYIEQLKKEYAALQQPEQKTDDLLSLTDATAAAGCKITPTPAKATGVFRMEPVRVEELLPYLNWNAFLASWETNLRSGVDLLKDAKALLASETERGTFSIRAVFALLDAERTEEKNGIRVCQYRQGKIRKTVLPMLRTQKINAKTGTTLSLADFVADQNDHIGLFAISAGDGIAERAAEFKEQNDDYNALLIQTLANALAEACTAFLHHEVKTRLWGYDPEGTGKNSIRPAIGYPVCPDHTLKKDIFELLDAENAIGLKLTENMMMDPPAAVCGMMLTAEQAQYFQLGAVTEEQLADYAARRNRKPEELRKFLAL